MASTSSSTANDTSQSSTAAETTSQTSTTEEETITVEKARTVISKVATKIRTVSDEQCRIIHEEIGGVLTLDGIKDCFARYANASCTGLYTAAAFRELVRKTLDDDV
ncbi:hypothetical protein BDZ89DRAFT_1165541 [Hymenopellis radicata]|nr:hypothetical protein BDZ89DRAFT_1165541 [Hymenopellis radicata]